MQINVILCQLVNMLIDKFSRASARRNMSAINNNIDNIKNRMLNLSKPVSNIIQKELNFWESEKSHNTTKHTCCVFDK